MKLFDKRFRLIHWQSKKNLEKRYKNRIFLLFDNINIYKYKHDQHLRNKNYSFIHTIEYVYFIRS